MTAKEWTAYAYGACLAIGGLVLMFSLGYGDKLKGWELLFPILSFLGGATYPLCSKYINRYGGYVGK